MKWRVIEFVLTHRDLFTKALSEGRDLAAAIQAIVEAWNLGPDGQVPVMSTEEQTRLDTAFQDLLNEYPELNQLVESVAQDKPEGEPPELEAVNALQVIALLVKLWPILKRLLDA